MDWSKVYAASAGWEMSVGTFLALNLAGESKTDLKRRFGLLAVALDIPAALVREQYNSFLTDLDALPL